MGRRWIASCAVLTCLGSLGASCTTTGSPEEGDPLARLESLGAAWLRTPATVTYTTFEYVAGTATSIHQCLRQMVGGEVDRPTAVRLCSGAGELTLTWDPPEQWRMDVSNAYGVSELLSTPDRTYHCHRSGGGPRRCAPTSALELRSDAPFNALFSRPSQILDRLGLRAALTERPEREIAGVQAECFSAARIDQDGAADRADWCYSKNGVLLRSLLVEAGGNTTELEATRFTTHVADSDFLAPASGMASTAELTSLAGTWAFDALTGVPPPELPPGSVPDNRHDIVIDKAGDFHWGPWSGHVEGSGIQFQFFVTEPANLRDRFDDYGASVGVSIVGRRMHVWLPDLGQDRDVDVGAAVEDVDSPDMEFRRTDG